MIDSYMTVDAEQTTKKEHHFDTLWKKMPPNAYGKRLMVKAM